MIRIMKTVYFVLSTICFAFLLGLLAFNNVVIYPIVKALGKLVRGIKNWYRFLTWYLSTPQQ